MRKLLSILLLFILVCTINMRPRVIAFKGNYQNDYIIYNGAQIGTFIDSTWTGRGTRFQQYYIDGSMDKPVLFRFWTNYTWLSSNFNINITNSTFGTLHGGDTVRFQFRSTGYNSNQLYAGLGTQGEGSYIVMDFKTNGAFIAPNLSPDGTSGFDNCNWLEFYGETQNDNINGLFAHYAITAVSQHIWINGATLRGTNGFFPSSPHALSIPDFANDTTKAFKDWMITNCNADSLVGAASGITALLLGEANTTNQVFLRMIIANDTFRHYASYPSGPAGYLNISQCFGCTMSGCVEDQLGMNVVNPSGHAALNFFESGWWLIYNNLFAYRNFGTCIRIFNNSDLINFPNFQGLTIVYNNKDLDSRKYSLVESRSNTGDDVAGVMRHRTGPHVWNNIMYNPGIGTGLNPPSAYKAAMYELYDVDSFWCKNNYLLMCGDSSFTSADGPLISTWSGSGIPARFDTASNFVQQSWVGLQDSVNFYVIRGGFLSGAGVAVPGTITTDFAGNLRTVAGLVDVGPMQNQAINSNTTISIKQGIIFPVNK